jgi:beta-lactamase regulating signal transducer with metallopeptidase domain
MTMLLQIGLGNALLAGLIAVLALAAGRWSRRPALAHSLWLLVLLKLVTPPLVLPRLAWLPPEPSLPRPAAQPTPMSVPLDGSDTYVVFVDDRAAEAAPVLSAASKPSPWPMRLTIAAGIVWFLGTGCVLGRAAVHIRRFQRLLRFGRLAPPEVLAEAATLARRLGLRRCPDVVLLPGSVPPLVWAGWGRPSVYLPEVLLGRLDDEQRAALLAHELAHVGRRDHWVRRVELLAVALYWWYPLVWWARHQLQAHEEECCDAWVAAELSPRAYATAILETLDFLAETRTGVPVLASGLGRVHALKRRLTLILAGGTPRGLTASIRLALLAVAGVLLPLVPVVARMAPPEPPPAPPETRVLPTTSGTDAIQTTVSLTLLGNEAQKSDNEQWMLALLEDSAQLELSTRNQQKKKVVFLTRIQEVKESADGQYYLVVWSTSDGTLLVPSSPENRVYGRLVLTPDGQKLGDQNTLSGTWKVLDGQTGTATVTPARPVTNPTQGRVLYAVPKDAGGPNVTTQPYSVELVARPTATVELRHRLMEKLEKENLNRDARPVRVAPPAAGQPSTFTAPIQAPVPVPYQPAGGIRIPPPTTNSLRTGTER